MATWLNEVRFPFRATGCITMRRMGFDSLAKLIFWRHGVSPIPPSSAGSAAL